MKLRLLIFCLIAFGSISGQVYNYTTFPKDTGVWKYRVYDDFYNYLGIGSSNYTNNGIGIMESLDGKYYELNKRIFYNSGIDTTYKLLYDFNLTVGDTFVNAFYQPGVFDDSIGVVWKDDTLAPSSSLWPNRRILSVGGATWVEGVGNVSSWVGIEHPLDYATLSGGIRFLCIVSDSISYPFSCKGLSVEKIKYQKNRFTVYPNPASTELNFTLPKEINSVQFKLINTQGKTVFQTIVNFSYPKIDLPQLSNGLYVVQLYENGKLLYLEKLSLERDK